MMPLNLSEKQIAKTECPNCNQEVIVEFLIQDLEAISYDERGMGNETEYEFWEEVKCPICIRNFEIDGSVWEYPEGVIDLIKLR